MSSKGFRLYDIQNQEYCIDDWYLDSDFNLYCDSAPGSALFIRDHFTLELHTGTYDRNNTPIYEGDMLRTMSCEVPFKVEDIVSFLIMCGKYEAQHGVEIFPSLEVVK